mmetsp:Transcript_38303/g.44630  ORF Transcript_38303/g.44630 Transcript_38303/m.44630 type:complete len:233 (+) Transcript_38303:1-699(+)
MGSCFSATSHKKPDSHKAKQPESRMQQSSEHDKTILKLKSAQDKIYAQKKNLQRNADKCAEEAKQYIAEKKKERAIFALKRQKLFEQYLQETEDRFYLIQKSIHDVETAIETAAQIQLLKQTNDLIKQIESANDLEKLQEIAADMKEREQRTREFNELFNQNDIQDEELDQLYQKFEGQVVREKISLVNRQKVNVNVRPEDIRVNHQSVATSQRRNREPDDLDRQLEAALEN